MYMLTRTIFLFSLVFFSAFSSANAQALQPGEELIRGTISEIVHEQQIMIPASQVVQTNQRFKVALAGGEIVDVAYEGVPLKEGQKVILGKTTDGDGKTVYLFRSLDRRMTYVWLALFFVAIAAWVAGRKGLRALAALAIGLALLLKVIIPMLATSSHVLLLGIVSCLGLLFITLVVTYGVRRETMIAFAGICAGLAVVVMVTALSLRSGGFSGLSIDSNMYLAYITGTSINIQHILLVSILIGIFGILDDIAITQVSIVQELKFVNSGLSKRELFVSALRIGKSHAAALVNTLFFAYAGVLLPSLIYVYIMHYPSMLALNQEMFGIEIVRTLAGSIGFLLVIPITTALAVLYARAHVPSEGHIHS